MPYTSRNSVPVNLQEFRYIPIIILGTTENTSVDYVLHLRFSVMCVVTTFLFGACHRPNVALSGVLG